MKSIRSEGISQQRKDSTDCEVFSHLQECIRKLIELSGLQKSEIAEKLKVQPSIVSAWLDRTDSHRNIKIDKAKGLLRLVKKQPLKLMMSIDETEKTMRRYLDLAYGEGVDPDVF